MLSSLSKATYMLSSNFVWEQKMDIVKQNGSRNDDNKLDCTGKSENRP